MALIVIKFGGSLFKDIDRRQDYMNPHHQRNDVPFKHSETFNP